MEFIEIGSGEKSTWDQRQRWAHYLTVILAISLLLYGLKLKDDTLNQTLLYIDTQAGIQAFYPKDWLLDTNGNYVFRVRDLASNGFKTIIQFSTRPVAENANAQAIFNSLSLNRAQTLTGYSILDYAPYSLPNETQADSMLYTFISTEPNPFLENIPQIVFGQDILTISRGQAIIITFQVNAANFEQERAIFENFIQTLDF